MQITRGVINGPQKVVIYGPEGIGKSSFASQFPNPVFIDTEGSTKKLDVARTPKPSSWTMLTEQVKYYRNNPNELSTLILDTADWAERLCISEVCSKAQKNSLADFGHGNGYIYLMEEFGRLLNLLEEVVERGVGVVITAHAWMRKFEQPDELGSYDRWELKLQKKTGPLLKEWADMVLFANYKTFVVKGEDERKKKVQGGKRVMHTVHHPCWDAKNRHGLAEELPFDFKEIKHCIPDKPAVQQKPVAETPQSSHPVVEQPKVESPNVDEAPTLDPAPNDLTGVPKVLADLMGPNEVTVEEIQQIVAKRGYYPINTPIDKYDPDFISGVLVGAWPQVFAMIEEARIPF